MASIQTVEDQLDQQREETPIEDGLSFVLPHWTAKRHLTGGNPRVAVTGTDSKEGQSSEARGKERCVPLLPTRAHLSLPPFPSLLPPRLLAVQVLDWRLKSRLKTHAAALVICLNIAVDPPDIVKTKPCAKLECWVDPGNLRPEKAREYR